MPRETETQVELTARVDRPDYDEFIGNLPTFGATSWFIRTAVKNFNEQCKKDPSLADKVRAAIEDMGRINC